MAPPPENNTNDGEFDASNAVAQAWISASPASVCCQNTSAKASRVNAPRRADRSERACGKDEAVKAAAEALVNGGSQG